MLYHKLTAWTIPHVWKYEPKQTFYKMHTIRCDPSKHHEACYKAVGWEHTKEQICNPLLWRHNDHDSVLNHQPHGCLISRLFRHRSKKTSKLRVTGLCVGNSPGPVNSPHKGPVTRKMFPFDDVIMQCMFRLSWYLLFAYKADDMFPTSFTGHRSRFVAVKYNKSYTQLGDFCSRVRERERKFPSLSVMIKPVIGQMFPNQWFYIKCCPYNKIMFYAALDML